MLNAENPLQEGLKALAAGETADALGWLEKAVEVENTPLACSCLAYCRAKEKGTHREALAVCMEAMKEDPKNPHIYLNLGRIYLLSGLRRPAIRAFDLGLRYGRSPQISNELRRLGLRKSPPLPFLPRTNPVNKMLGKFFKKVGLR